MGTINVAFVRPSDCLSVRPSVAYIVNNSRTQSPSVPKFEKKVPHLRCDSHTSVIIWSELEAGGGIPCRPNPAATLQNVTNNYSIITTIIIIPHCHYNHQQQQLVYSFNTGRVGLQRYKKFSCRRDTARCFVFKYFGKSLKGHPRLFKTTFLSRTCIYSSLFTIHGRSKNNNNNNKIILYYCLYYCLFILCVFLLNLRYFLCYHVMVNKVVYIIIMKTDAESNR